MLFGANARLAGAMQAQLILAALLLAVFAMMIVGIRVPSHGVRLDFSPLPDWTEPLSGQARAMVLTRRTRARRKVMYDEIPLPPAYDGSAHTIEITPTGQILFADRAVDLVRLRMELDQMHVREEVWLELRLHAETRYEAYSQVIATIGRVGGLHMIVDNGPFRDAIG